VYNHGNAEADLLRVAANDWAARRKYALSTPMR
jgi:hypothetical protein